MRLSYLRTGTRKWRIAVIGGPGVRSELGDMVAFEAFLKEEASGLGVEVEHFQSNHEGRLLEFVHSSRDRCDAYLVNPGSLIRVGESLRHTLKDTKKPCVEIHCDNTQLRAKSIFAASVMTIFSGFGRNTYVGALTSLTLALDDIDFLNPEGTGPLNRSHGAPRSLYT